MALVNPQIAMSYRPTTEYQPRNALAEYAQLQTIQAGRQAQELNALKMQEAQAALEERNALRSLNPSSEDYESQLFKVSPQLGIQYRREAATTAAQRAAQQKSEFDLTTARRKFAEDLKRGLSANPSDENIVAFGQDALLQKLFTEDQVKSEVGRLLALPIDERARILSQAGASAAELRPQVVAPGSSLVAGGRAVFTAPERAESQRPIAVSPGQVLVDASGKQIFTAPERAESQRPIAVSPGQVLVDASGKQIFTAPERAESQRPITVSPGQVVIDPSGRQIFTAPERVQPERPITVSPGQVVIDPRTGQQVFAAPTAPERPVTVRPGEVVVNPQTGAAIFTAPANVALSDRFVPVGNMVFDRETQQYIAPTEAQRLQQQAPPALVPILRNGKPVLVPREEAVGQTPFSPTAVQVLGMGPGREPPAPTVTQIQDPADPSRMLTIDARRYQGGSIGSPGVIGTSGKAAPAQAAVVKQEQGLTKADDILTQLQSAYAQLKERKAIPSEQTNALTNIWASIAASGIGQVAGRTVGTAAQTQRDIIQSSRNQLLLAIKDATGLSAQQLNSNMELQTWLSSLTDPTRSIEANEAILQNVRRFIDSGGRYTARRDAGAAPAGRGAGGSGVDTNNPLLR